MPSPRDVRAFLDDGTRGDRSALNQLLPIVVAGRRGIASRQLRRERAGHTLRPTALVHEVYPRLVDKRNVSPWTAKRDWRTAKAWRGRELGLELQP
jgi:ECF sigma factor